MSLELIMVIHDAEDVIERVIKSALPYIDSYTILIDTDTKDKTREVAKKALGDLPGKFVDYKWINCGIARTDAIKAATKEGYLLLMDRDEELTSAGPLPELTHDMYELWMAGDFRYTKARIFKAGKPFSYVGSAHESLKCDEPFSMAILSSPEVLHHSEGSNFPVTLELLKDDYKEDPTNPRTVFYLAETYRDLGDWMNAIQFYKTRAEMQGGFDEETFYARYQLGCLLCNNVSFVAGAEELMKAWLSRPGRIEPLRALANAANDIADQVPPSNDRLFVRTDLYRS